jgi:hypothetical protein
MWAGSYERHVQTKAVKVPQLRTLPFESVESFSHIC